MVRSALYNIVYTYPMAENVKTLAHSYEISTRQMSRRLKPLMLAMGRTHLRGVFTPKELLLIYRQFGTPALLQAEFNPQLPASQQGVPRQL